MKKIWLLLIFGWLYGCDPAPSVVALPRTQFRTTPPSRLYFKNMRSYYYEQRTEAAGNIDYYILKKFQKSESPPLLTPVIADNWLQDEAYIRLEKAASMMDHDTLRLRFEYNEMADTLNSILVNEESDYILAKKVFERLKKGHKIKVYSFDKNWIPLFKNQAEQLNFLTVIKDYYFLTESKVN